MSQLTANAISGSGRIYKTNIDFGVATSGNGDNTDTTIRVRAIKNNATSTHEVNRAFMAFNTSTIPVGSEIISVVLKLYLSSVTRVGMSSFGFYVVSASQANPASLALTDYTTNIGSSDLGSGSQDPTATGQYHSFTVSNTLVTIAGTSKVGLRSRRDFTGDDPEDDNDEENYTFQGSADANPPQLVVTYSTPGAALFFGGMI